MVPNISDNVLNKLLVINASVPDESWVEAAGV